MEAAAELVDIPTVAMRLASEDVLALWGFSSATPFVLSLPCSLGVLFVTTCIPYFAVAAVCHWLDTAEAGKRFRRYKIQQLAPPLTADERREAWKVAAFNMIVLNSVAGSAIAYPMWLARGPPAIPNWLEFPVHLAAYLVLTDLWFYATHRLMHTKHLYARFHKQHHRFKAPEAICGAQPGQSSRLPAVTAGAQLHAHTHART